MQPNFKWKYCWLPSLRFPCCSSTSDPISLMVSAFSGKTKSERRNSASRQNLCWHWDKIYQGWAKRHAKGLGRVSPLASLLSIAAVLFQFYRWTSQWACAWVPTGFPHSDAVTPLSLLSTVQVVWAVEQGAMRMKKLKKKKKKKKRNQQIVGNKIHLRTNRKGQG